MTKKMNPVQFFLRSDQQNAYLRVGPIQVYVRKGYHAIGGGESGLWTFDIANIEVAQDDRGKGHFTRFVQMVEEAIEENDLVQYIYQEGDVRHRYAGIYVENVFDDRFANKLVKMGFQPVPADWEINSRTPSFFAPRRLSFGKASGIDWAKNAAK